MVNRVTEEELVLQIGKEITECDVLTLDELLEKMFRNQESSSIPSVLKAFVSKEFFRQSKNLCRHVAKYFIAFKLKEGSSEFIKSFTAAKDDDQIIAIFPSEIKTRLQVLKENEALGSVLVECVRIFNRLREKFVPMQSENHLRVFLVEWFQSGLMPLTVFESFSQWNQNGATLSKLKSMKNPSSGSDSDTKWRQFERLVKEIKTNDFVETEKLQTILNIMLASSSLSIEGDAIKLVGKIVYLSKHRAKIEELVKSEKIVEVSIYAEYNLTIDCDLTGAVWQGKNLILVSQCVSVLSETKIRLSGESFEAKSRKAASSNSTARKGNDGNHGRPGESSGNLLILATRMFNPTWLSVELNGGRGEDGEDGGDGCDGCDGVGVTRYDLDRLCISYNSLYRDSWANFNDYSPPSNWRNLSSNQSWGEYILKTYRDENDREITYSFASDKGYFYTTYELYFLMRGSNGTMGSSGGSNGVGGQGGYCGTYTVMNPESREDYPIKATSSGGQNGSNGKVGLSGKCGTSGNDMALIDRSAKEASKYYEGSLNRKLASSYVYKAQIYSRLNGYKRYVEKESACFIMFQDGETITTSHRRANETRAQSVRKASSEAVAKQSIVIGKVMSQAESLFGKESAFLADACQESAKTAEVGENVDEEAEATENVTEEVVLLRQKEEPNKIAKYTPDSEKKVHTVQTPQLYVTTAKKSGRSKTMSKLAQLLFDLFTIEFPPSLLDSISLITLFQQIDYRQKTQTSLALVLVSAFQAQLVNGKSYNEIKDFNATLLARRKQKFNLSRIRGRLQKVSQECDAAQVEPLLVLAPGSGEYFGVKEAKLSDKLVLLNAKEVVKAFFCQYLAKEVSLELLKAFNTFLSHIKPHYELQLNQFDKGKIEWTEIDTAKAYLDELSAWNNEEEKLKKKAAAISAEKMKKAAEKKMKNIKDNTLKMFGHAKDEENEEKTEEESSSKQQMRPKKALESAFDSFHNAVIADKDYWIKTVKPLNELISKNEEYKVRFGPIPGSGMLNNLQDKVFSHEPESFQRAKHLIKLYFMARTILEFNRSLFVYNAMMYEELGNNKISYVSRNFNIDDDRFDEFLDWCGKTKINTESHECEVYMIKNGLNCAAFRLLLSRHFNVKLYSYREVSFQTLRLVETQNPTAQQTETIWLKKDGTEPVGIAPDEAFRELVSAHEEMVRQYKSDLDALKESLLKMDFNEKENVLKFVSFFPSAMHKSVIEWIESYMVCTRDNLLLQLLYNRMWVDGCQTSLFELQSILMMLMSLKELFHCDIDYLLLLANSANQAELVNVLLYAFLEYQFGRRMSSGLDIFSGIQAVQSSRYKSLFFVKLRDYSGPPITEEDVFKIMLMLQNASNGAEQLEKMSLDEWIEIAHKQKWSEIGALLHKYGSIGYYLGILDNKGFKVEEVRMRALFDQSTVIPEKLIALITQWIVTREVEADRIFEWLEMIFQRTNEYPKIVDRETKHQLLTNELEQAELLEWLMDGNFYEIMCSKKDRSVDDLAEKITGLQDTKEEAAKRRECIRRVAGLLKDDNEKSNKNVYWLKQFDDVLAKKKEGKRLRATQKMAILCAVEGDKRVLEQVNTGEGKSLIIAAIATIHLKTGKRFVDVITSSPVLAQRDMREMRDLYDELGLTVAHNCSESFEDRKKAYAANIVYGDMARFQRDHLLHTFYKKAIKGDRTQVAVIVDEVDNMLLDNGNNMLYLSHAVPGVDLLDSLLVYIQKQIHMPIFNGNKEDLENMMHEFDSATIKSRVLADLFGQFSQRDLASVLAGTSLTEAQVTAVYDQLIKGELIDGDGYLKIDKHSQLVQIDNVMKKAPHARGSSSNIKTCFAVILSRERFIELPTYLRAFVKQHLDELIENCKTALSLEPNTGYVVDIDRTGKITCACEPLITIIDSNTGADLATSQWSGGLHQFLQLKHGCRLSPMSLKAVFVSNVAYLNRYEFINGLSGTLGSEEESKTLRTMYNADLIKIPTNRSKVFYEHVPVIANKKDKWIKNIYDEICDQSDAKRSVLLICEDIKQLDYVNERLHKLFEEDNEASESVIECFENVITYKREHDEFDFEDDHKFESRRLIIATNLAGRGTDIKLSDQVITEGGMHVIVAFMPKNCRIEEQAFGRAARCGQPGSGQIIAYAEPLADAVQPSVFQLKTFRDNAEVHRLQSLKGFYEYHTEIEETCLAKFLAYSETVLSAMNTSKEKAAGVDQSLPTPTDVVYFALLDQWALWLDSKAPLIKQCSLEKSENKKDLKDMIINSVEEFKKTHQFQHETNCFEAAKSWINSPQALLTIGIIQMFHAEGFHDAEETFDRVLEEGHEFAGEAFYYKACMRMKNFHKLRAGTKSLNLIQKKAYVEKVEQAVEYFYKSRTAFLHRLQRKEKEAAAVAQMIEKLPENNPKTSGYAAQVKSVNAHLSMIIANIDQLLGSPCHEKMFAVNGISEEYSKRLYDLFVGLGVISPTLLTGRKVEDWQLAPFKHKYMLQRDQIETMLNDISNDQTSQSFDNYIVLDPSSLLDKCPLSTKSDFWAELNNQHTLFDQVTCLMVPEDSQPQLNDKLAEQLKKLTPYAIDADPDETRTLLRYTSEVGEGTLYKMEDIKEAFKDNKAGMDEVNRYVNSGVLKLDKLAQILIVPETMTYFSRFDGITLKDIMEFFCLDKNGAMWILNLLTIRGILMLETVQMVKFTSDSKKWETLVRSHLQENAKPPKSTDPIELRLIYTNAGILQEIKDESLLLNVTKEVINCYCRFPQNEDRDNALVTFYSYLEKQALLEPYLYNIWRLNSRLDCSSLPACIADQVDAFLADRFAYSFALEKICQSLELANKAVTPAPSRIFLPEHPFREVAHDMINSGLAMPARICITANEIDDTLEFEDYGEHAETIKLVVYSSRLKLHDQTDYHMELVPLANYVRDQGLLVDADLNNIINNGLKVVVGPRKETAKSCFLNSLIAASSWCWNKINTAARAFSNFCFSVLKFGYKLPVGDVVAPYLRKAGDLIMRIAQPLLDTKLGKAMVKSAKEVAGAVQDAAYWTADKALSAAEWMIEKGTDAVNWVSKKATDAVNWVADTDMVKGIKSGASWLASTWVGDIFKSAANMAMYVYKKMSNFCTAVAESYKYYNQCRTMARRIVNESYEINIVDEHTLLETFQGVTQAEAKKTEQENRLDDQIRQQIELWRVPLANSLNIALDKKLEQFPDDRYDLKTFRSFIESSSAYSTLRSELSSLLNFLAWSIQIGYFSEIKDCFESKKHIDNINKQVAAPKGISEDMLFFIEDAIDQILDDLQERFEDEAYVSGESDDSTDSDQDEALAVDQDTTRTKFQNWKEELKTLFGELTSKTIEFTFVQKSVSVILSYMASIRDEDNDPSVAQLSFSKEDKQLKQALMEYSSMNQSKRKAQFLTAELYYITRHLADMKSHFSDHKEIIRHAIKYGYPLPLSAAKLVADAMHRFLVRANIYFSGIELEIKNNQNSEVIVKETIGAGGAKVRMRHFDGAVYISQSDYRAALGMSDKMNQETDNAFFYEAFISFMKNLKGSFPKHAETLRSGLLGEF